MRRKTKTETGSHAVARSRDDVISGQLKMKEIIKKKKNCFSGLGVFVFEILGIFFIVCLSGGFHGYYYYRY